MNFTVSWWVEFKSLGLWGAIVFWLTPLPIHGTME
jgi:hypothetical protein